MSISDVQLAVTSFLGEMPGHTQVFLVAIMVIWLLANVFYSERTIGYTPTILTTTGIFATFLGIALGLRDFNPNDIQSSVPQLLGGLKTAFWASVFGVGGALLLKFRYVLFGVRQKIKGSGTSGEITAADLAALLRSIQQALVGNDDSTLVSQIKLTRSDTNERLDALRKAQAEALQKLSEMGSKQLVEALRDVIKDFNSKITEQFGDNFKQLNDAVGKLLVWQEQYKAHIEETTRRQSEVVQSMGEASGAYKELVGKAEAFSRVSEQLSALLASLETQKHQLTANLKSLGDLLTAASGALPQIEAKVVGLTDQMTNAVSLNQKEINKALTENALHIRNSIQNVGQDVAKVNQDFGRQIAEMTAKTREQVTVLDKALSEELQKSLESLGRQLAALSEKFVSDYAPLTDKLRAVVQMARA